MHSHQAENIHFHLLAKRYVRTSLVITTNLIFWEWSGWWNSKITTVLLDWVTHYCDNL